MSLAGRYPLCFSIYLELLCRPQSFGSLRNCGPLRIECHQPCWTQIFVHPKWKNSPIVAETPALGGWLTAYRLYIDYQPTQGYFNPRRWSLVLFCRHPCWLIWARKFLYLFWSIWTSGVLLCWAKLADYFIDSASRISYGVIDVGWVVFLNCFVSFNRPNPCFWI